MEPAKIDWKRVEAEDSIFVDDEYYENMNAPKWVDFLAPPEHSLDDDSWFCRPDCNHPKTAEDFLITTPTSKLPISADTSKTNKTPLGSWNLRDARLKRRGQSNLSPKSNDDCENQNPNFTTPPNHQTKSMKSMIKSSTERKKLDYDEAPRLKSTLSARNLFGGKDLLSQIGEFCNELKKLASRVVERQEDEIKLEEDHQEPQGKDEVVANGGHRVVLGEIDAKEREKPMLVEAAIGKPEGIGVEGVKEKKSRNKRIEDVENIPVPLTLSNVKSVEEERLLQIRTNPPSPQCFTATPAPAKSFNAKESKSRFMERKILQELKQNKEEIMPMEEIDDKSKSFSIVEEKEAKAVNVFWFLKPCTIST